MPGDISRNRQDATRGTLVDVLQWRARKQPDGLAYTFLRDGLDVSARWTYAELAARAAEVAAALDDRCQRGDRVLLLYPQGLEFIAAFLGCLSLGAVAVPVAPPRKPRDLDRLRPLAADAGPQVVLAAGETAAMLAEAETGLFGEAQVLDLGGLGTASGGAPALPPPRLATRATPDDLALLQYTSGSTAAPRGVMVRHRHLMANEAAIAEAFQHDDDTVVAGWLPFFHDMGLIGNVLQPLYAGVPCVLMPPAAFVQRPVRWLQAISTYRATTSGGPNFAFELCARHVSDEEKRTLDLSRWRVAFTGAEPVRAATIRRFTEAFAPCGFRDAAWLPCFGLAEATLMVSGHARGAAPTIVDLDRDALSIGRVAERPSQSSMPVVGCGPAVRGTEIVIVDPETRRPVQPEHVGEIWIAGPGVADGYWRDAAASRETFSARLDDGTGRYLRTGDLGFVDRGELFLTGRLKDVIIVRGRNHYPHDIELTVERAHPALQPGGSAAFALADDEGERVVVVQEWPSRTDEPPPSLCSAIRTRVANAHDLDLHAIAIVPRGRVPKTTSGKTRRSACRDRFLRGELAPRASWTRAAEADATSAGSSPEEVQHLVARVLRVPPGDLPLDEPLVQLGLSSISAMELLHALEDRFGAAIALDELRDRVTIRDLLTRSRVDATTATRAAASTAAAPEPAKASPLSLNQQSIYAASRLAPDSAAYHICCAALVDGIDSADMRNALAATIERHAALRSRVELKDGHPWQVASDEVSVPWEARACPGASLSDLLDVARDAATRPFALDRAPLWRATWLGSSGAPQQLLLLVFHHLIADLWSLAVIWRELAAHLGDAQRPGARATTRRTYRPSPGGTYDRFVSRQAAWLASEPAESSRRFWTRKLAGGLPAPRLPLKGPRPAERRHRGARVARTLDATTFRQIADFSRAHGVTPFSTLAAAFEALLARYTGQARFAIGTPTAGRTDADLRNTVGYFVNPILLGADLSGDLSFLDLLARVRQDLNASLAHAAYPFASVTALAEPTHSLGRTPLGDVMFVYQELPRDAEPLGAFAVGIDGEPVPVGVGSMRPVSFDPGTSQRDLTLTAAVVSGRVVLMAEYDIDLFETPFIRAMLEQFERLLACGLAHPDAPVSRAPVMAEGERRRLLAYGAARVADTRSTTCLHERFERHAARTPDAGAVCYEGQTLTYGVLNARANRLARYLRARGAGPERLVAIDMERSPDLLVAILATLKAGAAYVPLDPAYPSHRRAFMLADAAPHLLLTHAARRADAPEHASTCCLDEQRVAIARQDDTNLQAGAHPLNLAYVIYTSGSTGQPKGCMVTHHNVLRLFDRLPEPLRFDGTDTWTMFHSAAFDFSVWEMWGAWLHGGRLVVVPQATCPEPEAFARLLCIERATVLSHTPSAFQSLLRAVGPQAHARLPDVRWIIFGGEALDFGSVLPWFGPRGESGATLVNLYGITETTVHVTSRIVSYEDAACAKPSAVGGPLPDMRLSLLDPHLQLVPAGAIGEIGVGGAGLTRGYLNRPDLTAERFVPDPSATEPGSRLYRSGDLGRFTPSGDLEYHGRSDHQVQLHGYRIEPGEIEAALLRHPGVEQAVVVPQPAQEGWFRADAGAEPQLRVLAYRRYLKARPSDRPVSTEQQLVAYVVPAAETHADETELRAFLARHVPPYMLPAAFVVLDELPRTASGKVHRAALPPPGQVSRRAAAQKVAPRTARERDLLAAWRAALPATELGIDDNFFTSGGDSIRAIQVLTRAAEAGLTLSVQDFYRHPTVREMAAALSASSQDEAGAADIGVRQAEAATAEQASATDPGPGGLLSAVDRARLPAEVEEAYPLARMQAGLIYHSEQHPQSPVYRASFLYRFEGDFDRAAFESASRAMFMRHAVLRTAFDLARYTEPLQLVSRDVEPHVAIEDLRALDADGQELALDAWFDRERERGFDFAQPPLARLTIHRLGDRAFTVGLTCHDAILDGWSTALVLTELVQRYAAERARRLGEPTAPEARVPPLVPIAQACAYRELVALERRDMASASVRDYWVRALEHAEIAPIPISPPASPDDTPRLGVVDVHLPGDLSDRLTQVARRAGVPLKHILLAAHLRVIRAWSGADDVITGVEMNGRPERPGGEWSVGQHLNTVPFRHRFRPGSWLDLIRAVTAHEQELLPFRRFPYAEIQRLHGGGALYDTTFNYTHFHVFDVLQRLPGLRVTAGHGRELTHYTLKTEFNKDVFTGRLHLDVIFNAGRMADSQARAIAASYVEALQAVATAPLGRDDTASLAGSDALLIVRAHAAGLEAPRPRETLTELCEREHDRSPDRVAVELDGHTLTFTALHARANRLARHLRALGVDAETMVGVHLARSFDLVVALLAVLKAGGAYVPLDTTSPDERLRQMVAEAGVRVVITTARDRRRVPAQTMVVVDESPAPWTELDAHDLGVDTHPLQATYALFTSGSTGRPKGAVNTHEGLCNRLRWMQEAYPLTAHDRVLHKTPISFDVSGWELFWPLITGATMVLAPPGVERDSRSLVETIQRARITTIHFVPSLLRVFLEEPGAADCTSLRRIICSGEALAPDLVRRCHERLSCDLHNLYGPTEAAIDVTAWTTARGDTSSSVPIGRPIANMRAFVLDSDGWPAPPGAPGELYLSGPNLARGYAARPDLTADRFLPCAWPDAAPGARMYRTGDRARLRADGAIEFLGRLDAQVKVHGVRIEPAEIEAALTRHPACAAAAVVAQPDTHGKPRLVAYVIRREGEPWSPAAVRAFLSDRFPAAMVPTRYIPVSALPWMPSGKLDRRRLAGAVEPTQSPEDQALADLLEQIETLTDEDARALLAHAAHEHTP